MVAMLCKDGGSPCDYLFPGERNPFFRLAVDTLCLQIRGEYETLQHELRELEREDGNNTAQPPQGYEDDPEKMKAAWNEAMKRVS